MVSITLRFPIGVYYAQAQSDFARAEWPPHPVRLIAALVAAAHRAPAGDVEAGRTVLARLAAAAPPLIEAPRLSTAEVDEDEQVVAELRGASRWAPRNHELGELKKGISPRDLGRGRAEVHKVGVAVGDLPVTFTWPRLGLDSEEANLLRRIADEVTFVGASRSPVLTSVVTADDDGPEATEAWRPVTAGNDQPAEPVAVRVPNASTLTQLDVWHARRAAPVTRSGAPAKAPLAVAPRLGAVVGYVHDREPRVRPAFDPRHWGEMFVLAVTGAITPKAPASFALARATRKALLDGYSVADTEGEAPAILRGRGAEPHAAFVPLSFVSERDASSPAARAADGRVLGIAVLLPHESRVDDLDAQRDAVVNGASASGVRAGGLVALIAGTEVRVPGVGPITLASPDGRPYTLRESRYLGPDTFWTTITPVVHSRYRTRRDLSALFDQVAAECRDVGLPIPAKVEVRRVPRLRGAPSHISARGLPNGWAGPLKGPQAHLDLWFDEPVMGPILLGRARHFGLGLCLPCGAPGAAA